MMKKVLLAWVKIKDQLRTFKESQRRVRRRLENNDKSSFFKTIYTIWRYKKARKSKFRRFMEKKRTRMLMKAFLISKEEYEKVLRFTRQLTKYMKTSNIRNKRHSWALLLQNALKS